MSALSSYLEDHFLDYILNPSDPPPAISNIYLALCTSAVTEDDDGSTIVEPSGNGYARVDITSSFGASSSGSCSNDAEIAFPEATGSWGTVTHWAILDGNAGTSSDNLLLFGALSAGKSVGTGDILAWSIGDFTVSAE